MEEEPFEIKLVSEREIWVEKNRFYLANDNTLYLTIVGGQDNDMAIAFQDVILKLLNMTKEKVNVFVDNNLAKKSTVEARRIFEKMSEREEIGKIAIFGLSPVARVLASFIIGVTKKKDMRFFNKKEEALAWLKE